MKELYSHKVITSFYLWFDHTMVKECQAFQNVSGRLYHTPDERVANTGVPYASPYKQWVYDSSIPNVQIPDSVLVDGVPMGRGDGIVFDFDNGRILGDGLTTAHNVTGAYSRKEFNTYVVNMEDQKMVFEGNFQHQSKYNMVNPTGVNPHGYALPACFIMNTLSDNKPFAFGGMQDTKNKMRVIVVTDDVFALDGVTSVFRDLTESIIPVVSMNDSPLGEQGDFKSTPYDYDALAAANAGRYLYIEKVSVAKTTTTAQAKANSNLRYGIIDFYLSEPRFPKTDL
jgi:hypothetical protein